MDVYTNRLKKIRKICKKYGLSAADEGNIPKTKAKIIQTEFSHIMIPPLSDKVEIVAKQALLRRRPSV